MGYPDKYAFNAVMHCSHEEVSIIFPDLPGCIPCGDTMEEALKNAKEAMALHLYGMEQDEEEIPAATPLDKIELNKHEEATSVEVFMPPWRIRIAKRLF